MNSPLRAVILLVFWAVVALPIAGPIVVAVLGKRFSGPVRAGLLLTGCITAVYTYYLYRTILSTTWIYRGICVLVIPQSTYQVALYCGVVFVALARLLDWRFNRCPIDRRSLFVLATVLALCFTIGIAQGPKFLHPFCGVDRTSSLIQPKLQAIAIKHHRGQSQRYDA
jgi:hypothetical protein